MKHRYEDGTSWKVGDHVYFRVENQNMWSGDTMGTLIMDKKEWKISCPRSGVITIGKGYDAYPGTLIKA